MPNPSSFQAGRCSYWYQVRILISQKKANSTKCLPFVGGAHLSWSMDLDLPKQIQYTKCSWNNTLIKKGEKTQKVKSLSCALGPCDQWVPLDSWCRAMDWCNHLSCRQRFHSFLMEGRCINEAGQGLYNAHI